MAQCTDLYRCRTSLEIIRGCLATVFGCTWVTVHPNVPHPEDTVIKRFLRRALLVVVALIAPEIIIMWAMRQCWVANELKKKYDNEGAFRFSCATILFVDASHSRL